MIGSSGVYVNKTDYVKEFGKDLGWSIEEGEFANIASVQGYQTADDTNEDAYPEPTSRQRIVIEKENASVEETYYWFLQFLRQDLGYPQIDKIYDIFSSSESSAMFGNVGQKQGIQQDRATQFLRYIGEMIKQMFPLVRELRVIDERMEVYDNWETSKSADVTLKHLYVSLVEGGGNNPDSVYSLARQLNYTVLPDLFFNTHIYKLEDIDKQIDSGQLKEFNKNVRTVLKRKFYQYINWRHKTYPELQAKRQFQLHYMRQHWKVIQLYMSWAKPYLKTANRMSRNNSQLDSPELINAFDNTILEIEVLAKKPVSIRKKDGHYKCILAHFRYDTKPTLTYQPQYQQQAVGHTGRVTVTLRSYGWHKDDIETYKKMRQEEDLQMIKQLDSHLASVFEALGDDFEKYLLESQDEDAIKRDDIKKKKAEEDEKEAKNEYNSRHRFRKWGPLEPFIDMGAGIGELGKSFVSSPGKEQKKEDKKENKSTRDKDSLKEAAKGAAGEAGVAFIVYKKAHQYLSW